jgi:hypothetical protein
MVHVQSIQRDGDPEKWPFLTWALELLLEGVSVIHRGGRLVCPNIRDVRQDAEIPPSQWKKEQLP